MTMRLDITGLQEAYRSGALDPAGLLGDLLSRIAETGAQPVWISVLDRAALDARLERLEARRQAGEPLPLYGVPFAVKDNIDVAGLPTTAACPAFAYNPERSAAVIERLEAAGAVPLGKTNLDQFATGLNGTRSPYGAPSSVFDPAYISGGSSSGSAVAVAAGQVSFALGTDTAGSGRVPAAFNNIVGLKPSRGLLSNRGLVPACRSLDCISILAGSCADAATVLAVAEGFDPEDSLSRRRPTAPASLPADFRFGVPAGPLDFCGDKESERLFGEAVARLESLGGRRVSIDFTPFAAAARLLYQGPYVAERLAALRAANFTDWAAMDPTVAAIIRGAERFTAVDAFQAHYDLAALIRATEPAWASMDCLLLPTAPTIFTHRELREDPIGRNSQLGIYTNFVNLMDLSAIAVPAGSRGDGLPFGVTLVAPAFAEPALLPLADALHRGLPDPRWGGTGEPLPPGGPPKPAGGVTVAVVGAHLSGQPLNRQLVERGARLVRTTRTAAGYRLFALPGTVPPKPGLIRDASGAGRIEIELWEMDHAGFGSFVALIPPPLGIGTLALEDGGHAQGFLCEPHALDGAEDITAAGGWRAYLAQT
jgi:allophanate hydrolase